MSNTAALDAVSECLIDYRGKTPPKTGFGVRLITAKVVKDGRILDEPKEFIATDFYERWMRRGIPQALDVLITTEAPLGEVAILRSSERVALAQRIILIRANRKVVDPVYLYYALQGDYAQGEIRSRASGTTVSGIKQSELRKVRIPLVDLALQRRISGTLSAYDELLENNCRRIHILEEMACVIFDEWFLHFRFPGHDGVVMVDSLLGPAPEGWSAHFGDLVAIERDAIDPSDFADELFEHFSIPAYDEGRLPALEVGESIRSSKYLVSEDCVLLSKLNPRIPRVWLPVLSDQHRAIASTEFLVLKPSRDALRGFVYTLCSSETFKRRFAALAGGTSTSHQRVKPQDVIAMPSVSPPDGVLDAFNRMMDPLLALTGMLRRQNANLRATRDLLLHRLMSGQLSLAEAEAAV